MRLVAGSSGPVHLDIGDRTTRRDLAAGQRTAVFDEIAVPAGDFPLAASAGEGEDRRGAHQVALTRR